MKKGINFIIVALLFILGNCSKKEVKPVYYPNIQSFGINLEIRKGGAILPASVLKNARMSYMYNGVKHYVSDFKMGYVYTDTSINVVSTVEAYWLSSTTNRITEFDTLHNRTLVPAPKSVIAIYYIEYPNGMKTDTMGLVTTIQDAEQAANSSCGCIFPPPVKIQFNGKPAVLDTALSYKAGGCIDCYSSIYLLEK